MWRNLSIKFVIKFQRWLYQKVNNYIQFQRDYFISAYYDLVEISEKGNMKVINSKLYSFKSYFHKIVNSVTVDYNNIWTCLLFKEIENKLNII